MAKTMAKTALNIAARTGMKQTPLNPKVGANSAKPTSGKIKVPQIEVINDWTAFPKAVR